MAINLATGEISMSILQTVKDGLELIEELEPGLTSAVKAGAALGTMGSTVVKLIQKGKRLATYVISHQETEKNESTTDSPGIEPIPDGEPMVTKSDVAVIVDVSRRMLSDVARYLDDQQIDADIILLTNDPEYGDTAKLLDVGDPESWTDIVKDFHRGMSRVKREVGASQVHIFLGAPLPLAFGMGAVWGTVDEATVYHWENKTYHPVMPITRELRR
jgi:hypothetical protein